MVRGRPVARGRGRGANAVPLIVQNTPVRGRGRGRARGVNDASASDNILQGVPARARGRGRGRGKVVVDNFVQATSSNLPVVTCFSVAEYYENLMSSELRQAKDQVSASADYGDTAIGYVKLKRDQSVQCTVQASITPQTSVSKTPYNVAVDVNECNKNISNATCTCQASAGSCKHQTALIFWLLRRSEEPPPTAITCYWKKSVLSTVKGLKSKTIDELSNKCTAMKDVDDSILKEFIELGKDKNKEAGVIRYSIENRNKVTLYVDHLVILFLECHTREEFNVNNFVQFCSEQMTPDRCLRIFNETIDQSSKTEWHYQRFGRITASKLYECSKCKTPDGSLVASIMGARKFKGNFATKRGLQLENEVFNLLKKKYPDIKKCGIVLRPDLPMFGASPDGISNSHTFEIKCPSKAETVRNYVRDGVVQDKVFFQIQLQMLMCNKSKGFVCIADPKFEENQVFVEYEVVLDEVKLKSVLEECKIFWEEVIFQNLK